MIVRVCTGVKLCDVYNTAMEMVERERPELKENFTRNAGYIPIPQHHQTHRSPPPPPPQVCDGNRVQGECSATESQVSAAPQERDGPQCQSGSLWSH